MAATESPTPAWRDDWLPRGWAVDTACTCTVSMSGDPGPARPKRCTASELRYMAVFTQSSPRTRAPDSPPLFARSSAPLEEGTLPDSFSRFLPGVTA